MRQPVDAMEVHFSDHELRDLKKEQRLRREEKEARESKINALLEMAEETIREERSGIDEHGEAVQGAAAELTRARSRRTVPRRPRRRRRPRPPDPRGVLRTEVFRQGPVTGRHRGVDKTYTGGGGFAKQEQEAEAKEFGSSRRLLRNTLQP